MKTPEITRAGNEGGKMRKPQRLWKAALAGAVLFYVALVVYVFSLGPVAWLCGARAGGWEARLPRGVQAVYGPILGFPDTPDWYGAYLSHFVRQPPPWKAQDVVLAVSPQSKVTLHVPKEWMAQVVPDGGTTVGLVSSAPPNGQVAYLNFTPDEPPSATQEDVDDLLRIADAGMTSYTPGKLMHATPMRSALGTGACTVFSIDMDFFGHEPDYKKVWDGIFLSHGVLVKFGGVEAGNLPQVMSFIEGGITVDAINSGGAQKLELAVSPQEKVKLQPPAGWIVYSLPVRGGCWQVMMKSPAGMKMMLFAALSANVTIKPPLSGPAQTLGTQMAANWASTWPEDGTTVVPLKLKSGQGAYVVNTSPSAGKTDVKQVHGALVAGDVLMVFSSDNIGKAGDEESAEFLQAVKFIEEGIAVEGGK